MKNKKWSTPNNINKMKNKCLTYIQWSIVNNKLYWNNNIVYQLKQVITILKVKIIGYYKSI